MPTFECGGVKEKAKRLSRDLSFCVIEFGAQAFAHGMPRNSEERHYRSFGLRRTFRSTMEIDI
jgi:hypothetical protein